MRRGVAVLAVVLAAACARSPGEIAAPATTDLGLPALAASDPAGNPISFDQYQLQVSAPEGGDAVRFDVYDADDPAARARGLMLVRELPPDAGMLFRFARAQASGFWMKNTLIPLSIAFADEAGVIVKILDMEPCEADPCPVYSPGVEYRYALEVNRGAFDEHQITEGWTLNVPSDLPPAQEET